MSRWFRFYDAALDDPKVQRLSDIAFRTWVNLLCVASRNGGMISADISDTAFQLRITQGKARDLIQVLQSAGLIDPGEEGWEPHNWKSRQYESDSAAERMRRHRDKKKEEQLRNPLRNSDVPEQIQIQNRTESKKRAQPAEAGVVPKIVSQLPDWMPLEAWGSYLDMRRKTRRSPTAKAIDLLIAKLDRLRQSGHDPTEVLNASTINNWTGIFEPKADKNGQRQKAPSSHDKHFAATASLIGEYLDDGRAGESDGGAAVGASGRPLLPP